MNLIQQIRNKAIETGAVIVLPEAIEERTLRAADFVLGHRIAELVLLGSESLIKRNALQWNLEHIHNATIIDPSNNSRKHEFAELLLAIRAGKGLDLNQALALVEDPLYLAPLLIKSGEADGEVAGAINATGDVLRPAFQIVKTKPGVKAVSGAFIMLLKEKEFGENGILVFADCAVNPDPGAQELAEIAIASAATAHDIAGIEPRVAMLKPTRYYQNLRIDEELKRLDWSAGSTRALGFNKNRIIFISKAVMKNVGEKEKIDHYVAIELNKNDLNITEENNMLTISLKINWSFKSKFFIMLYKYWMWCKM